MGRCAYIFGHCILSYTFKTVKRRFLSRDFSEAEGRQGIYILKGTTIMELGHELKNLQCLSLVCNGDL